MSEAIEIQQIAERLQGVLENFVTRGLGSASVAERNMLKTLGDELGRAGAAHLTDRVTMLLESIDARDGPEKLLRAFASLRLFERVLTLEVVAGTLEYWKSQLETGESEADDESDSD